MASKKPATCDRVRRKVAGKTRDEIMDAICAEFDLPRPKKTEEQPDDTAESVAPITPKSLAPKSKRPRKVKP